MKTQHFQSVSALLDARPSKANQSVSEYYGAKVQNGDPWVGVQNEHDGKNLLLGGWSQGDARAREVLSALQLPQVSSTRRRPQWGESGDEVCVDRVRGGELNAWRSSRREVQRGQSVTAARIYVSNAGSWNREGVEFFWRGAVAVTLADALEESGRSVEIIAYSLQREAFHADREDSLTMVTLKQAGEPLNRSRVIAMTAHPAAQRLAMFRGFFAWERRLNWDLGSPVDYGLPESISQDDEAFVVAGVWTQAAAERFLANVANRINGES